MSRSNQTSTSSNPSQRFLEWGGEEGILSYWDKDVKESITVKPPFTVMVLDELSTITGYDGKNKCGVYSNEIKDTKTEVLTVKSFKGGEIAKGLYADIKDKIKAMGYKYSKSIYIAYKDGKDLKIGNMKFSGAALNAWIDFSGNHKDAIRSKAIKLTGSEQHTTGKVNYFTPVFAIQDITPETDSQAIELDKQLQAYFKEYFGKGDTNTPTEQNPAVDSLKRAFDAKEIVSDDLPF